MKNITIEELAKILDKGLNEEIMMHGDVSAKTNTEIPTNYMGFSYHGKISIRPVNRNSKEYEREYQMKLIDASNVQVYFSLGKKKFEVFLGRSTTHTYYEPYITIPVMHVPPVQIKIERIREIMY